MKIETFNILNLIPVGDINFKFKKNSRAKGTNIYIGEINIMCETDRKITPETTKAVMKMMKKAGSDLLTDGRDFFTTRGEVITQINHPSFNNILEDNRDEVNELLYK